jgi:hypothetical protein
MVFPLIGWFYTINVDMNNQHVIRSTNTDRRKPHKGALNSLKQHLFMGMKINPTTI